MNDRDFLNYGEKGSEVATKCFVPLVDAIKDDMIDQGRDFRLTTYSDRIHKSVPLRNKSALKRGYIMGKKLLDPAIELNTGDNPVRGQDLARCVYFILGIEGFYQWDKVRETVRSFPSPWNKLAEIESAGANSVSGVVETSFRDIRNNLDTIDIATELEDLAKRIRPLQKNLIAAKNELRNQNLTILHTVKENSNLKKAIANAESQLEILAKMVEDAKTPEDREKLAKKLAEFRKKFEKI